MYVTAFACCTPDGKYVSQRGRFCYPVKIPAEDKTMGKAGIQCMNFTRTVTDKDMGCAKPDAVAQQVGFSFYIYCYCFFIVLI